MAPKPASISMAFALCCALLLSACAGTARGKKESVYQHDASLSVVDLSRSSADAMVVIRYPAIVDEDAAMAYFDAFSERAIGGTPEIDDQARRDTERIAQALIAKSNFYAMSLYRELRDRMPDHAVLLSPHLLYRDDNVPCYEDTRRSAQPPSWERNRDALESLFNKDTIDPSTARSSGNGDDA